MPTPDQLRTEFAAGPFALEISPFLANAQDQAVADVYNDPSRGDPMPKPVPIGQFALAAAGVGLRAKIEAGAQTTDPPAGLCKTLLELITVSPHIERFDPANGLSLMSTLKDAGVLTAQDVAIVTAIVTQPASRAENLYGVGYVLPASLVAEAR